jgi:hypothetical protein
MKLKALALYSTSEEHREVMDTSGILDELEGSVGLCTAHLTWPTDHRLRTAYKKMRGIVSPYASK